MKKTFCISSISFLIFVLSANVFSAELTYSDKKLLQEYRLSQTTSVRVEFYESLSDEYGTYQGKSLFTISKPVVDGICQINEMVEIGNYRVTIYGTDKNQSSTFFNYNLEFNVIPGENILEFIPYVSEWYKVPTVFEPSEKDGKYLEGQVYNIKVGPGYTHNDYYPDSTKPIKYKNGKFELVLIPHAPYSGARLYLTITDANNVKYNLVLQFDITKYAIGLPVDVVPYPEGQLAEVSIKFKKEFDDQIWQGLKDEIVEFSEAINYEVFLSAGNYEIKAITWNSPKCGELQDAIIRIWGPQDFGITIDNIFEKPLEDGTLESCEFIVQNEGVYTIHFKAVLNNKGGYNLKLTKLE